MDELRIDTSRKALLSIDLQSAIGSVYTKGKPEFIPRVALLLDAVRKNNLRLMHVQMGSRPGLPEVDSRSQLFGVIKNSLQWQ